ncbi:MAG TPA: glycerol-3-phosphate dehydrogenase/oxidase [Caulobacteraceae bacterium]
MDAARLDLRNRDTLFADLSARRFDLAVIGGGITGAGVARDAALRGLSVVLIEAGDFACGTSSRSSKMIHGGLRYLAQGDIALVREAASERKVVQAIAPHLALETPFVIGARSQASIARLRAGLWTFEKLGGVPKSRAHQLWSHADMATHEPAMKAEDLAGAVVYPEYLTNDARLTLANVLSAAAAGATIANYARVERFIIEGDRAVATEVADQVAGGEGRTARVSASVIVNAAGPWVDAVRALESSDAPPRLALSRGIHLVVRHDRAPARNTWIIPAGGGRSIFVVPKGLSTYIGTTDNFHHHADVWPPVTAEDADYLLAAASARLTGPPLTHGDIHAAWSGVRPLVNEPGKRASEISRRDEVWTGPAGVISIAGGKLTAYRRMAQRVTDKVETSLDRKPSLCRTAREPLPGGETAPDAIRQGLAQHGVTGMAADRLIGLYGAVAPGLTDGVAAEATHAVLNEGALHLEDYWVRRSGRAWFDDDGGLAALEPAARAMAPLLGWDETRLKVEIDGCRARRAADLAEVTDGGR